MNSVRKVAEDPEKSPDDQEQIIRTTCCHLVVARKTIHRYN